MAKPTLLLDAHLKALRLPTFLREYALVHNSRSRSIIALHPEIRGPA